HRNQPAALGDKKEKREVAGENRLSAIDPNPSPGFGAIHKSGFNDDILPLPRRRCRIEPELSIMIQETL
ncbi:MAG TPA: hypothetical protein PLQ76_05355, partial [bacterium]|nr:hypothetical protein [bacterium]